MVALSFVLLGSCCLPPFASAVPPCATLIADSFGQHHGPWLRGISCSMPEDPLPGESQEATWTVPDGVQAAEFYVLGGDEASAGHGGVVDAALSVTPGETLTLFLGIDGNASSVSREGAALIVASGANGQEPSYVAASGRSSAGVPGRATGGW
jgi:hypothetical protein